EVPDDATRLAVAERGDAVLDRHALQAAGVVDGPGDILRLVAADLLDGFKLLRGEVLVPAHLHEQAHGDGRVAVLDLRADRIALDRQQAVGDRIVLGPLVVGLPFDPQGPADAAVEGRLCNGRWRGVV